MDVEASREIPVLLSGATKSFGEVSVLDGIDLTVRKGETLAVLGPSGTGKSVLLKVIIGLLRLDSGKVCLWGTETTRLAEESLAPFRRRMGLVFQSGALFDSMTVGGNVAYPLLEKLRASRSSPDGSANLVSPERIRSVVEERLEWVGLSGCADRWPSELSGGMRKRLALARTLAVDPELILYDEPTTGLDPLTGRKISQLIRDVDTKLHSTSIVVTHDIDCAHTVAGRWAFLSGGRILADGTPRELMESQQGEIRAFLEPALGTL